MGSQFDLNLNIAPHNRPCSVCGVFNRNRKHPTYGHIVCEDHAQNSVETIKKSLQKETKFLSPFAFPKVMAA